MSNFKKGDTVIVNPDKANNAHVTQEFQGTIVDIYKGKATVNDQEDNAFTVDIESLEPKHLVCPECGEPITTANCYSQCIQVCTVDACGFADNFSPANVLGGDSTYECSCGADITHLIKE